MFFVHKAGLFFRIKVVMIFSGHWFVDSLLNKSWINTIVTSVWLTAEA